MFAGIRGLLIVFALVAPVGEGALAAPSSNSTSNRPAAREAALAYEQKVQRALNLAGHNGSVVADPALADVLADPSFQGLAPAQQYAVLAMATQVAINLDQLPRARDLTKRAILVNPESPDEWYRLSQLSRVTGDLEGAGTSMIQFTERWPELLDNLEQVHILQTVRFLDHDSPTKLALLEALFAANWDRNGAGASTLWYDLAALEMEHRDMPAASAAMARVTTPAELVKLRTDRRFDSLVDRDSWKFNVENAARLRVDALAALAQAKPRSLSIRTEYIDALLTVGRHDEALAQADAAIAAVANAGEGKPPFDDIRLQVWLHDSRAIALRRLGRNDEAIGVMERASAMSESGAPNISQVINLGSLYCALGRGDEALATVARVGKNLTGYGRLALATVQQCAALLSGDRAGSDAALAYIRDHRKDSPSILLSSLLEADLVDEAANTMVALLASPADRPEVLGWAQGFRQTPPLVGQVRGRNNRDALLARQDVRDAVAKVGRIESFDIY